MEIELTGFATVSADVRTLGDLIEFVEILKDKHVDADSELDWGRGRLHVDLKVHGVEWIGCGDHYPVFRPDGSFEDWSDVIIVTHAHEQEIPGQMTIDDIEEPTPDDTDCHCDMCTPYTPEGSAYPDCTCQLCQHREMAPAQRTDYDWPAIDRAKRKASEWREEYL